MKKINSLLLFIILLHTSNTIAQNVGIGTATPTSKLHVLQTASTDGIKAIHTGATGSSLVLYPQNSANTSPTAWFINATGGIGMRLDMSTTTSNNTGIYINQDGTGAQSSGMIIDMDAASVATSLNLYNLGSGSGIYNLISTYNIGLSNDLTTNGGTGVASFFNGEI